MLLAVALTGGVVTGAVLGPASAGSPASDSPIVRQALALLAARELSTSRASTAGPAAPSVGIGTIRASGPAHRNNATHAGTSHATASSSPAIEAPASAPSSAEGPASGASSEPEKATPKPARLPPIQHVWLISLAGSTFSEATSTPATYPYLAGQLVKQGTLLTGYSALDAYELAGDAALLPGGIGAALTLLSEPVCATPSGSAAASMGSGVATGSSAATGGGLPPSSGAPCAPGTQPTPDEADAFLQRVATPILSSAAYREDGLIAITFGLASGGSEGASATLAPQPIAGALLLSPLLHGAQRSSTTFDALSPRTSVETIFKR
ncbi:MAG TPA: hypothetical protein VK672_00875 [Solirubrobacteraceae bacterium]|nr:hypothetical protein [Solirubrobacteraceae bacterium]